MISVKSLYKTFTLSRKQTKQSKHKVIKDIREQGNQFHTLQDLHFHFAKGEIIGLLGSNGAGKTTLMRILSTSLQPSAGTVQINGFDVRQEPLAVRRSIGVLSGNTGLYGRMTPRETLQFFGKCHGLDQNSLQHRITELFDELEIHSYADRKCDDLSTGMKQKVAIARSVLHSPEVLIFDEPTTGLDVGASQAVLNFIERLQVSGKTIIFSTHHMDEVSRLCDRVMVMAFGRKHFEGSVDELLDSYAANNLNDAYLKASAVPMVAAMGIQR